MNKSSLSLIVVCLLSMIGCTGTPSRLRASSGQPVQITATQWPTATQEPFETMRNIHYAGETTALQSLDIRYPSNVDGPYPTILAFHGGHFRFGSKSTYDDLASYFASQGYAFVSANYRLAPVATYPAQVEDAFCSLAWVYAHKQQFSFDTSEIVVMGDSAGGYLAAMVATVDAPDRFMGSCPHELPDSELIDGAVAFYGAYDVTEIEGYPPDLVETIEIFMGSEHSQAPEALLREMSPIAWVDRGDPPVLLIHGTADTGTPSWLSERFARELASHNVPVELLLLEDAPHNFIIYPFSSSEMRASLSAIEEFLDRYVET